MENIPTEQQNKKKFKSKDTAWGIWDTSSRITLEEFWGGKETEKWPEKLFEETMPELTWPGKRNTYPDPGCPESFKWNYPQKTHNSTCYH